MIVGLFGSSGSKLNYKRDCHFLDAKPVNVGIDDIDVILQDMKSVIILTFFCMENRQVRNPIAVTYYLALWLTGKGSFL